MRTGASLLTGIFLISVSTAASAVVLPSLSRATFQTAIIGTTTLGVQNFDALQAGSTLINDGTVTYGSSLGTPLVTNAYLTSTGTNGLGHTGLGYFQPGDTASFKFASAVTAFAIDINTFASSDGSFKVLLNTGDTAFSIFENFPGIGTGQFIGFTSPTPFTSVTMSSIGGYSYTLDTLIYGNRAAVIAPGVPEPALWALLMAGFGITGVAQRRRVKTVST